VTQTHRPTAADVIAWFKDEQARRVAAEARIAALETAARRSDFDVCRAFVERVNARAEARMQAGNPLEGSHYFSMQAELRAMEDDSHDG
jgi:hypothetical protein